MFEPAPWTIAESNHCATVFEKLRLQREQGRFCDVILKVNGREFHAHRCVLASCSSVFDRKFNVHKTMKESVEVENVKNYEVFHLVLTYMYTGKISLEKQTVADILDIAHLYSINKLKNYCSEFLERYLRLNNCLKVAELSTRYHLVDLSKQAMSFMTKNFKQILQYNEIDKKVSLQEFLSHHHSLCLPAEIVLRLIMRWISQDQVRREEQFVSLLNNVNWATLDQNYLTALLEDFKLSEESFLTLLTLIKNNIGLEDRFHEKYQELQEKFLGNCTDFGQELEDNNSFLSFAINTAVKDLENQEVAVDETFSSYIFQQESLPETVSQYNYRPHHSSDLTYKPAMDSGIIGMESPYVGESKVQVQGEGGAEFLAAEEELKTPLRVSTSYGEGSSSSMMFPGSKVMMTPDNSAASSPIAQSIPSPVGGGGGGYKAGLGVGGHSEYSSYHRGGGGGSIEMYQSGLGPPLYREDGGQEIYRLQPPTYINMDNYRASHSQPHNHCVQGYDNFRLAESEPGYPGHHFRDSTVQQIQEEKHYGGGGETSGRVLEPSRHKQGFDFISEYQMIEQVINEQEENTKYHQAATKRYDPKHRALAQAFRKKDSALQEPENYFPVKHHGLEPQCSVSVSKPQSDQQINFDPLSQQESGGQQCPFSRSQLRAQTLQQPARQEVSSASSSSSSSFVPAEAEAEAEEVSAASPRPLLHLTSASSSCAAPEPLQTPEKSDFYPSCLASEDSEQARAKPEPQQLFLTPKEKYAKEVSAQNQQCPPPPPSQPPPISFDLSQTEESDKPRAASPPPASEPRTVFPSALKILKSKKKMASQKRLILENGDVRLTQTQRQRIKIKKKSRRLRAKDIFQPSESPVVSYSRWTPLSGEGEAVVDTDSQAAEDTTVSPKKIIVNRKDKLLAEHRSQNPAQPSPEQLKNAVKCSLCSFSCATQHKLKIHEKVHRENRQYNCPFCAFKSYWIKDHYQHIQVE